MSETKTYTGGCHCGAVRFEVQLGIAEVMECNCSICSRIGWKMSFAPGEQFKLLSGAEQLAEYRFGKKHLDHTFCKVCGIHSFSEGKNPEGKVMRAVNVRCLDDVDYDALPVKKVDGKSR